MTTNEAKALRRGIETCKRLVVDFPEHGAFYRENVALYRVELGTAGVGTRIWSWVVYTFERVGTYFTE